MTTPYSLPLFPLNVVLFPQGILPLRIFEARYLDMVKHCLRNKTPFGVVAVTDEKQNDAATLPFAQVGTICAIAHVNITDPGLMNIRGLGLTKFKIQSASQQKDGLWIAEVIDLPKEMAMVVPADLHLAKTYMQQLIESLTSQNIDEEYMPIAEPFNVDDCAWLANRWTEVLDIPLQQKQRMLALDSPLIRLELVQDYLNQTFIQ